MALSLKDPEVDRLARELADRTGETLTEAIRVALRDRLVRLRGQRRRRPSSEELREIGRRRGPSRNPPDIGLREVTIQLE